MTIGSPSLRNVLFCVAFRHEITRERNALVDEQFSTGISESQEWRLAELRAQLNVVDAITSTPPFDYEHNTQAVQYEYDTYNRLKGAKQ